MGRESEHGLAGSHDAAIKARARLPSHLQTQLGKDPLPTLARLLGSGRVAEGPASCWLEAALRASP